MSVRERRDPDGTLSGYGRREPAYGTGDTVFYGGGKLAADLSLPKLQARWAAAGGSIAPTGAPSAPAQDRGQLWRQATQAAADAAEQVRRRADSGDAEGLTDAGDAAAEVLSAASRLIEGDAGGPLTQAARNYDATGNQVHRQRQVRAAPRRQVHPAGLHPGPASSRQFQPTRSLAWP